MSAPFFNCHLPSPRCPSLGLQQELKQLNAEILKAQEEVSFLSTYMDHEYPVRSVQIANQIRQVQQAKDRQQVREPLAPIPRPHGRWEWWPSPFCRPPG